MFVSKKKVNIYLTDVPNNGTAVPLDAPRLYTVISV